MDNATGITAATRAADHLLRQVITHARANGWHHDITRLDNSPWEHRWMRDGVKVSIWDALYVNGRKYWPTSVRQAVNLLVDLDVLPVTLHAAYAEVERLGRERDEAQARLALATTYTVCAHPDPDSIDYYSYAITVEERAVGQWAVCRPKRCLDANGNWDWEPIPSERTDEWLAAHRFDLPTALRLAHDAAPKIRINGRTATGEGTDHA